MDSATIDMAKFCASASLAKRFNIDKPWVRGGVKYATDTAIAIAVPCDEPDTEGTYPNAAFVFITDWKAEFLPFADPIIVPHDGVSCRRCEKGWMCSPECGECHGDAWVYDSCPECDGAGKCAHCGHECDECDGSGTAGDGEPCEHAERCGLCDGEYEAEACELLGKRRWNIHYMKLLRSLPGARYRVADDKLYVIFDGGKAVLISLREDS